MLNELHQAPGNLSHPLDLHHLMNKKAFPRCVLLEGRRPRLATHESTLFRSNDLSGLYVRRCLPCSTECRVKRESFLNWPEHERSSFSNYWKRQNVERANGPDAAALMRSDIITWMGSIWGLRSSYPSHRHGHLVQILYAQNPGFHVTKAHLTWSYEGCPQRMYRWTKFMHSILCTVVPSAIRWEGK